MLEILEFIFKDPWHYFGTVFLIYMIGVCLSSVVKSFCPDYKPNIYNIVEEREHKDEDR